MKILKIHIVGLPYCEDIEDCVAEFLEEAPGRTMTIRAQRDNEVDSNAIRAYDWQGRHVGFVSSNDLPEAWGALLASGSKSLRGTVSLTNREHPCAVFESVVNETFEPADERFSQKRFLDWHYDGPVLELPVVFNDLDYLMEEIDVRMYRIEEMSDEEKGDFICLLFRFIEKSVFDISAEMEDFIRKTRTRLMEYDIEDFEELAEKMSLLIGRKGRGTKCGALLEFWMSHLRSEVMGRRLLVYRERYDVKKIEKELKEFPDDLYSEWLVNPNSFVSKIYYKHIPREVLWHFVSGIAFVEAVKAAIRKEERGEASPQPIPEQGSPTRSLSPKGKGAPPIVMGDYVLNKHVGNSVNNVDSDGVGINLSKDKE